MVKSSRPRRMNRKRFPKRKSSKKNYRPLYTVNYPLAKTTVRRLKYVDYFNINPAAGLFGSYIFSANGLYDPNISGTGHQPYAFDTLMQMYNHYIVLGSKIRVTAFQVTGGAPFTLGIKLDDDGIGTGALLTELMEQPDVKRVYSIDTTKPAIVTKTFSAKKQFGTKFITGDDAYRGSVTANPSEGSNFIVYVGPINETSDLGSIACVAEIEYIVKFIEPKTLAQS